MDRKSEAAAKDEKSTLKIMKKKHKKGLWSPDEDQRLSLYILNHSHVCWSSVPINAGLKRNGKSCRLRWVNYLRPGLKRGILDQEEEQTILTLHSMLGNKWSQIAQYLPGRTDNEIKNYWHSHLKKKADKFSKTTYQTPNYNTPQVPLSSTNTSSIENGTEFNQSYHDSNTERSYSNPVKNSLPRIMFKEWLLPDQFHDCISSAAQDVHFNQNIDFGSSLFDGDYFPYQSNFAGDESFLAIDNDPRSYGM